MGTLHEINSENSTVALENVTSYGTEGRKNKPDEEIPPSDNVYEYIVFRGSDVKDLRIEEAPAAKENKPPQVPNDPAILGVSVSMSRPILSIYDEELSDENFEYLKAQKLVDISVAFLLIDLVPTLYHMKCV